MKGDNTVGEHLDAMSVFTYDILVHVFSFLKQKRDLALCSGVCREWRRVASNPVFLWEEIRNFYTEHHWELPCNVYTGKYTIEAVRPPGNEWEYQMQIQIKNAEGNMIGVVKPVGETDKLYLELAANWPRSWRITPYVMNETDRQRYTPKDLIYRVQVEFNPKRLEQDLRRLPPGKENEIFGFDLIRQYASSQNMRYVDDYTKRTFPEVHKPLHYEPDEQPPGFKTEFKLYNYQLEAITWMKSIELEMPEVEYHELIPWRVPDSTLYFSLDGKVVWSDRGLAEHTVKANPKGGILADEMGLGKTAEMLGLILGNPADGPSDELDENPPPKEKEDLFYTPATLVLCPNHVVKQWVGEIEKLLESNRLAVVTLSTMSDMNSTTYRDICKADLVIVSYQLIKSTGYFRIGSEDSGPIRMDEEVVRQKWISSHLSHVRTQSGNGLSETRPILEHFIWHRLVLDEGHEILDIPFYFNTINTYIADNKWYMTGTPFGKGSDLMRCLVQFLEFPESKSFMSWVQFEPLLENRYWRNTRASIRDENEIEVYSEEVLMLDFTPVERLIYADFALTVEEKDMKAKQREYCSHSVPQSQSLTLQRAWITTKLEERIENHKRTSAQLNWFLEFLKAFRSESSTFEIPSEITTQSTKFKRIMERLPADQRDAYCEAEKARRTKEKETCEDNIARDTAIRKDIDNLPAAYGGPDLSQQAHFKIEDEDDFEGSSTLSTAAIKSMSVPKLIEELTKRNIDFSGGSPENRVHLERVLLDALRAQSRKRVIREEEDDSDDDYVSTIKKRRFTNKNNAETPVAEENANQTFAIEKQIGNEEHEKDHDKEQEQDLSSTKQAEKEIETEEISKIREKSAETIGDPTGEDENVLDFMIEKYGTKLGNLVFYLKNLWKTNPRARVMIFSQFSELLNHLYLLLEESSIKNAFLVGNVLQVKNTLSPTHKSDYPSFKAIMLSLANCTGNSVIECSHIVLMEPMTGTLAEVTKLESRAIGRAYRYGQTKPIKVVRMLIKDTIEHDLYKQNHSNVQDVSVLVRSASTLATDTE